LWLAAFPSKNTQDVLKRFKILYPVTESQRNILEVGLNNGNPVVHQSPSLLNAGRVEYAKGEFYPYVEGITPHVTNVIQAVDEERLALCKRVGFQEISSLERLYITGYSITKSSLFEAYHSSPVFCGEFPPNGPENIMCRYYTEDTAYGLLTWSSLGDTIGIETPTIDSIIFLISKLHNTDYFAKGERNMKASGLSEMNIDEINFYLETGKKKSAGG